MKNFIKIAQGVDVLPLALELHQQPHLWNRNDARLYKGSPHDQTDDIWIRYNDETEFKAKNDYRGFNDKHESIWYPAYYELPSVRKIVFDLARRVESEQVGGILIWRIPPGKEIRPHKDASWHVDFYDKFNVCIQSLPGCAFVYEGEAIEDRPGDIHRFVNTETHSVVNRSADDYIVMCVCLKTHDYQNRFKG